MAYRLEKLKNGVSVVLVHRPGALSVTVLALADAGAKNEKAEESGYSHFLEHLALKGTSRRPKSLDIYSELDSIGANSNAVTSHDFTGYYVTVVPDKTKKAIDILADVYQFPLYNLDDIEKEKGVIIEEIKLYEDKPNSLAWENFLKTAYGDTPQGRNIAGTRETVSAATRQKLLDFRARHYLTDSTYLVVVGAFDSREIISLLNEKFSALPNGRPVLAPKIELPQTAPKLSFIKKAVDQAHMVLGFRSFDAHDEITHVLNVLSSVLGGGASSRLWQEGREGLGAAYYIGSAQNSHQNFGYFSIYGGIELTKLVNVVSIVLRECDRLKKETVSETELRRVKDSIIGSLFLGLETTSDLAFYYGEQAIWRKPLMTPEQLADKINAVSAGDLREAANLIFTNDRLNLSAVGPAIAEQGLLSRVKLPK